MTRYVSLGSIAGAISAPLVVAALYLNGKASGADIAYSALVGALVVLAHADNIARFGPGPNGGSANLDPASRHLLTSSLPSRCMSEVATLPNLLGLFRLVATPVLVVLLLWPFPGSGFIAFVLFVPAALSDLFDGWIARSRGQVTTLGAFLDLTADKVLVSALLIALVEVELAAAWLVIVILVREFVVGGVRQVAASEQLLVGSQLVGKAKTVVTLIGIGALLLAFDAQTGGPTPPASVWLPRAVGTWLLVAGMALALVSGIDYVAKAWPLLTGPRRGRIGRGLRPAAS